jgi:hypothetical protein
MTSSQLLLSAVIAALWTAQACAVSTQTQLTPKTTKVNGLLFKVVVKDAGQMKEVEIVVKKEEGKEYSPYLEGRLSVYKGKKLALSCPVEKKEKDGELHYRFQVDTDDVGKVRFDFSEYAYVKSVDGQGRVKFQPMPAVDRYWLELKDFVGEK